MIEVTSYGCRLWRQPRGKWMFQTALVSTILLWLSHLSHGGVFMSTNPYAAPSEYASYAPPPPNDQDGFVKQIPFVGVFMIVEGVLETLYGLCLVGAAIVLPFFLANDPEFQKERPDMPVSPAVIMAVFYLVWGAFPLISGVLRIFAGSQVLRRKSRTLAIVANIVGFMCVVTCYCIPTGFATSIYALIVLLQPQIALAFAAGPTTKK